MGPRKESRFREIEAEGARVLVEGTLAPYLRRLQVRASKFLWFRYLKVEALLSNGATVGGKVPPSLQSVRDQPWPWRPR
jgi:hypothetical protein